MILDIIFLAITITLLAKLVMWIYRYWFGYKCQFCGKKVNSQYEKERLVCYQCDQEKRNN
ncbi:MAG: Hydrogenase maturation factor HypA [Mycoplasmataceae bacterium]|nr:MAG: Hydrogenase maturation factor HypA [Mycoplasmataceae bacterium]